MNLTFWLAISSATAAGSLAMATIVRAPRSVSRWAFTAGMTLLAVESLCAAMSFAAGTPVELACAQQWGLFATSLLPGAWLLFAVAYARGNASSFFSRWRGPLVAIVLVPAALSLGFRGQLLTFEIESGPEGFWTLRLGWPGLAVHLTLLVSAVLVLVNLERTYRASVGTMRWRIKFMLLGLALLFCVRIYASSQALLFHSVDLSWQAINCGGLLLSCLLITRSLARHGSFTTEVYPSREVLHKSLSVILIGIYLVTIAVLAKIAEFLGGDAAFTLKAFLLLVGFGVLALILQSDRVQMRLRAFVSRHFRRPVYDFRSLWRKFSEGSISHADEIQLCQALVTLVADTCAALSVSIWLLDEDKRVLNLVASTALPATADARLKWHPGNLTEMKGHFRQHPEPIDIDSSRYPWAEALRHCHPSHFPDNGGQRVCLPLNGRDTLLGVMILGDRVGGTPFSVQDLDMLTCVGEHAAAGLLNVRLSQKVARAKELEAFQSMAAFLVHDLKNAASTLALMLKNIPKHGDDPEFREDALRGISKAVIHINEVVGGLSRVRHGLQVTPAPANLNEVVQRCLSVLEHRAGVRVVTAFAPIPPVCIDMEQISKVIINLLLNAAEALPNEGEVRVATSIQDGNAVLTVADTGCGMTVDFLRHSLFKPFRTTKKGGIGIGMYQSKTIIEAHTGRISVDSEIGKGTTLRISLPLAPADSYATEARKGSNLAHGTSQAITECTPA